MTQLNRFAFVLMPFSKNFADVYECGIRDACVDAGVRCERVDEQRFDETILDRICGQIQAADIIIAEMTGRNPNVFYEVGYAHALHKRVILLTKNARDIQFDLKHHRHIVYGGSIKNVKAQLLEELKWCLRTPPPETDAWASRSVIRRIIRILADVSKTVAGLSELQPLLENILAEVTEILDAEVCSIFLNDPDKPNTIRCVAGSGFAQQIVGIAEYERGEGFTGKVFQKSQTAILGSGHDLNQLRERNEFQGKYDSIQWAPFGGQSQFRNGVASPLRIGDETIGVIKVENKRNGDFTLSDVTILEAITNGVLAVAIQNARLLQGSTAKVKTSRSSKKSTRRQLTKG
jgi:hypothetical protein